MPQPSDCCVPEFEGELLLKNAARLEQILGAQETQQLRIEEIKDSMITAHELLQRQYKNLTDMLEQALRSRPRDQRERAASASSLQSRMAAQGVRATKDTPEVQLVEPKLKEPDRGPEKSTTLARSASVDLMHKRIAEARIPVYVPSGRMFTIVTDVRFDICMGVVIIANSTIMFIQLHLKAEAVASVLGLRADESVWSTSNLSGVFDGIDVFFNLIYLVEMMVRIKVFGVRYFKAFSNLFDTFVVIGTCADTFILSPLDLGGSSLNFVVVVRLGRICRIFRVAKVLRFATVFMEMRTLLRTLTLSVYSLLWAMVLIGGIIVAAGILISQMVSPYMWDESLSNVQRVELHSLYGSPFSSAWTMFESTFTGSWTLTSKPLLELSPVFAIFWLVYIVGVNFAVIRVVSALFLKQTLSVSRIDEERLAMMQMKERDLFASCLREIFAEADTSADGAISRDEFRPMIRDPGVLALFHKLDLDGEEVEALFDVLSADDDAADYGEFLTGALKMKSSARTIDAVQIQHQQLVMSRDLKSLGHKIDFLLEDAQLMTA